MGVRSCRDLFRYYHERLPGNFPFPAQPAWKGGGSPEQEEELEEEDPHAELHHDDPMGEAVSGATRLQRCGGSRGLPAHRAWHS